MELKKKKKTFKAGAGTYEDKLALVMNNLKKTKSPRDVSLETLDTWKYRLGYDRGEKAQHSLQ